MTSANRDPFPRLADALTEVSSRLADISNELRVLQVRSPIPPPPPYPAAPIQPTQYVPAAGYPPYPPPRPEYFPWTGSQHDAPREPAPPVPHRTAPAGPTVWERVSREGAGSKILAWVGGVVTLAGVVLLLVLAIQRGYIGPLPRVLIGVGLGGVLLGIGLRLHRSPGGRTGALAVAATGIAVLYLDVIAATAFYSYLPAWAGLTAGLGVAAAGVLLAARWDSQSFATFVVLCCAISAPVLTRGFDPQLLGFLLVLQIATTPVQLRKRWSGLALVAGAPPVLALLPSLAWASLDKGWDTGAIAVFCLVTGVVQVVVASVNAHLRPDDDVPFGLLLAGPIPTLLAAMLVSRVEAVGLLLGISVLLVLVWTLHRIRVLRVSERFALAAGAAGVLAVFEATCIAFDGDVRAIALLAGGLLLALLAERVQYLAALYASAVFGAAGSLLTVAGPLRPRFVTLAPSGTVPLSTVLTAGSTGLLLAAAALVTGWASTRLDTGADEHAARLRWTLTGGVALYGATGAMLSIGLAISPDTHGFLIGQVLVTVSWTVGALVLLLRHIDSTPLRVAGLALVGAALAKLVAFDLSSLNGIPRVLAFLGAGLVLLAAGARYAKLVASRSQPVDDRESAGVA